MTFGVADFKIGDRVYNNQVQENAKVVGIDGKKISIQYVGDNRGTTYVVPAGYLRKVDDQE